jgi:hypothetical protein
MAALTGGGLFGEPFDCFIAGTGAVLFLWAAWTVVRLTPRNDA